MVVLPEPDSPTMPSDSPGSRLSDTPSTAFSVDLPVEKIMDRSRTCNMGSTVLGIGARTSRMSAVRPSLVTDEISIRV